MSDSDLIRMFDEVDNLSNEKYVRDSMTNEWGLAISGGGETDTSHLATVLAIHKYIASINEKIL